MIFVLSVLNREYNFARVCFIYNLVNRVFRERLIYFLFEIFFVLQVFERNNQWMTLNQDSIQKPCFVIKLRGAVVPNSVLIFCMYVCLFVCLFAFCSTAGQGFKPNIGQASPTPNPSPTLSYTPRVEVVHPLVKFNPAWVPHFLLTNRKDNKQESTT